MTLFATSLFTFKQERRQQVNNRVAVFLNGNFPAGASTPEHEKKPAFRALMKRLLQPAWMEIKRSFKKKLPGEKEAKIEIKLQQAGSPFGMSPVEFRIFQLGMLLFFPAASFLYGKLLGMSEGALIALFSGGIAAAFWLPHFYLKQKTKVRSAAALRELPDILDLLTVSIEAGLGFDSAVSKVVSKKEGVLASEFHRALEEIRLGKTRREALSGIRARLVTDEVSMLISSILQAEKLGIGMVQVLRTQSAEVRHQRKQRAEEEAMKAPVKMLFPLVLFIFPSLFIVLLGPAILEFLSAFGK
ncbi:type II secretion system F family protein [Bacillus marinisedimentorum]|uniref:type II secretion system F family protein n=1 Tax=Bacillus marinisedimentorum TaxID=1821260 RepID=UPI001FE1FE7C|nr:type II secretion system F family protein [Bacillus marinisedimentorum]